MSVAVVGVDDGPHSVAAFKRALKMFNRESTQYHIVNVRPNETEFQLDEYYGVSFRDYWQELETQRMKKCQEVLSRFKELALQANISFQCVELTGDPRDQLCEYCSRVKADALVLGSRGAGFLARLLLGSVSTYCTSHAPCAVLIDRCQGEASEQVKATSSSGS